MKGVSLWKFPVNHGAFRMEMVSILQIKSDKAYVFLVSQYS